MKIKDALGKMDAAFLFVLKWVTIAVFVGITLFETYNVVLRHLESGRAALQRFPALYALVKGWPNLSITWKDEIVEMLFAALVFFGAAAVWILKGHFSAGDWIGKLVKNPRAKAAFRLLVDLVSSAFIAVFFWYSLKLFSLTRETTNILHLSKKLYYLCMPSCGAVMLLYCLKFIALDIASLVKPEALPAEAPAPTTEIPERPAE